jgi:hypothetical protein
VLNLVTASGHSFNGLLFKVTDVELRQVKEREDDYNLEETWAYDWDATTYTANGQTVAHWIKKNKSYNTLG